MCIGRNILIIATALGCCNKLFCQTTETSVQCDATFQLSERWTIEPTMKAAYNTSGADYFWGNTGANLRFTIYNNTSIFAGTFLSGAKYFDMENFDLIMTLIEGIKTKTKAGFEHTLYFEQRDLYFSPSDYTVPCSRFSYSLSRDTRLDKNGKYKLVTGASVSFNIRSDINDCEYLQRVRLHAGLTRQLTERIDITAGYTYMLAGKKQIYFDEANKYHAINLTITIH